MKTNLLSLFVLIVVISSCKDVEEVSPNTRLEGVYEYKSEGNMGWGDNKFNFVNLLKFKSDGTVTGEEYTTEIGSDEILGYRGYFLGTYTISKGKVNISYDKSYNMGIADINYMAKEDLTLYEGTVNSVDYSIAADYSQLSYICPPNAFCIAALIYNRMD